MMKGAKTAFKIPMNMNLFFSLFLRNTSSAACQIDRATALTWQQPRLDFFL